MKFSFQHLSDDDLALSSTGELSREDQARVLKHLSKCQHCVERLQELTAAFEDLHALQEERYPSFEVPSVHKPSPAAVGRPLWFAWTAGLVACSLLVTLVFFGNEFVVSAHASKILDRASASEEADTSREHPYKLVAGGETCLQGTRQRRVKTEASSCANAEKLIATANWNAEKPLSARSFEHWRKGLKSHHDTVKTDRAAWVIRTETTDGPLRAATLRLKTADYQPEQLQLEFQDQTLMIEAAEVPEEPPADFVVKVPVKAPEENVVASVNPLDLAEAGAWQALHIVDADGGWEASVVRQPDSVEVKGIVADEGRRNQLLGSLSRVPDLKYEIKTYSDASPELQASLPARLPRGTGEPIAKEWLVEHFSDDDERSKFRNDIRERSRLVLGRAQMVSEMKRGLRDVQHCAECRAKLVPMLDTQQALLRFQLTQLADEVAPYFNKRVNPVHTVSYTDAQRLDQALGALFSGAGDADQTPSPEQKLAESLLFRP